ncbi:MAG: hypothetical protein V4649_16385 [Bacteroidota bacterium]
MKARILCFAVLAGLFSCKKDKSQTATSTEQVTISTDAATLNSRISTADAGVVKVDPTAGGLQKVTLDSASNQYPMELIASVAPPVLGGDTLRATHVEINGNYAYVSYNTEGPQYKGGIDVFNISNPAMPALVSSVTFPATDISAITYYNNKLYVAGARDGERPAIAGYLDLTTDGLPTTTFVTLGYSGFTGTGIAAADGKVYLTTGSTGGLYVLDPATLTLLQSFTVADARGVALNSTYVAVQTGSSGINIYNRSTSTLVRNISMGADVAESKRTMDFNGNYLYVAAGKGGNRYYDVTTGTKLSEVSLPTTITGVNSNDIVTNAVSYNNNLFFSANGAAGAYICTENTSTHTLNRLGSFGFGTGNSINYVKSKNNYVFVAAGRGGMKIIRFTPASINGSCAGLANYSGSTNLNINSNQTKSYAGSLLLTTLNVNSNSTLFYCGSLAISDNSNINSNGTLEMQGAFSFGASGKTLSVNSNAVLRISGNATIYGNLNLNSNAKIEFIGTGNTITIYGTVTKGSNVTITGSYTDVSGKL